MGAYLPKPVTEKLSEDAEDCGLTVGSSSMQGWRITQEDAHNAILKFDENSSLFAVYDGHGGSEVAVYTARHLPDFIKSNQAYKDGDFQKALIDSFVSFDETLVSREVVAELKAIAGNKDEEEEHDPNEVDNLYKDATMPIEEVINQYNGETPPVHPAVKKLGESSGQSASKPISPYLRAKRSCVGSNSGDAESSASDKPLNTHIRFDENKDDEADADTDQVKTESTESKTNPEMEKEENNVPEKSDANQVNGDDVKEENGNETGAAELKNNTSDEEKSGVTTNDIVNGHINGDKIKTEDQQSDVSSSVKGKGKGKGKGKSNLIKKKPTENEITEKEEEVHLPQPTKVEKKKRSAKELYDMLKAEDQEYDESSDDDDETFGNAAESSDDDDDANAEESAEEEEEEESDTEEEEEEEEGGNANDLIIGGDFNEEPGNDSGCTAVVALLKGNDLIVANAGDSRCVVCRDGRAVDMSFDHKPEDSIELERIEKAGGKVTPDGRVNGGLNLSRALGDHAYKTNKSLPLTEQMISPVPDIKTIRIDPSTDHFMILACDGIWNSMSSQEVVDFINERINKTEKLSSICEELFDHCLAPDTMGDGTGCDNMTAVIVKLSKSSKSASGDHAESSEVSSKIDGEEAQSFSSVKRPAEEADETPNSKKPCIEKDTEDSDSR